MTIELSSLLANVARFARNTAGQVVASVAAAVSVAVITNAMFSLGGASAPTMRVEQAPPAPARADLPRPAQSSSGVRLDGLARPALAAFPMEHEARFETSLSRPFKALASGDWASDALSRTADAGAPAAVVSPRPRQTAAAAKPAVRREPAPVAATDPGPDQAPVQTAAVESGAEILGVKIPSLLPEAGAMFGKVGAMASSLGKLIVRE